MQLPYDDLSGNAGESDYDEGNTSGGVVMAQLNVDGAPEIFKAFNTGVTFFNKVIP